jgi:hypothetical protein
MWGRPGSLAEASSSGGGSPPSSSMPNYGWVGCTSGVGIADPGDEDPDAGAGASADGLGFGLKPIDTAADDQLLAAVFGRLTISGRVSGAASP